MKKIAVLILLATLSFAGAVPAFAKTQKTHNKYQGIDKASRKAQKREQKQMNKYAKAQQKSQRKMLKAQKPKKNNSKRNSLY